MEDYSLDDDEQLVFQPSTPRFPAVSDDGERAPSPTAASTPAPLSLTTASLTPVANPEFDLQEPFSQHASVSILDAENRVDGLTKFMVYGVQTRLRHEMPGFPELNFCVWRRFTEFEVLRNFLCDRYPFAIVPPIPEKKTNFKLSKLSIDKSDPEFLGKRRLAFQRFMNKLLDHKVLSNCPNFRDFLKTDTWRQNLVIEVNGSRHFWAPPTIDLKSMTSSTPKLVDEDFLNIRHYSSKLQMYVQHICTTYARVARQMTDCFTLQSRIATAFAELADSEAQLGDVLQITSQRLASVSDLLTIKLEDEEDVFFDPFREYIAYADAMNMVVEHHLKNVGEIEASERELKAKQTALDALHNPTDKRKGMTETERETRVQDLTADIGNTQLVLESQLLACQTHKDSVVLEVQRFHAEKVRLVRKILLQYAKINREFCLQNIKTFQLIREAAVE
eukprot:m.123179 g.123179  ORF g.123179 m.123179 type:complete len:448 (+) comp52146_c0_seq1:136-1479(+)